MGGALGAGLALGSASGVQQSMQFRRQREMMELQKKQLDMALKSQELNQQMQQFKMEEIARKAQAAQALGGLIKQGMAGMEGVSPEAQSILSAAVAGGDENAMKAVMERLFPKPPEPVKLGEGEALVNPRTGEALVQRPRKPQAAPGDLNAFAQAKFGAQYNDLDQATQAQAFSQFQAMEDARRKASARAAMEPIAAAQMSMAKSFGSTIGALMAKEESKMSMEDISQLVDAKALKEGRLVHPPPGMTLTEARAAGFRHATPKLQEEITDLDKTQFMLGNLKAMADKLLTAKTPPEALLQAGKYGIGSKIPGVETQAKLYNDMKQGYMDSLAKGLGGQTGVLTNQDIARAAGAFPGFTDTARAKDVKMAIAQELTNVAIDGKVRIATGDNPTTVRKAARAKIDKLLDDMEAVAKQAAPKILGPTVEVGK